MEEKASSSHMATIIRIQCIFCVTVWPNSDSDRIEYSVTAIVVLDFVDAFLVAEFFLVAFVGITCSKAVTACFMTQHW